MQNSIKMQYTIYIYQQKSFKMYFKNTSVDGFFD